VRSVLRTTTVLALLALSQGSLAQNLCPSRSPEADPLQIREAEITEGSYVRAITFLKSGLNEAIRRSQSLENLQDDLSFWIQYANSILAIEAYALKRRALAGAQGGDVEAFSKFLSSNTWSD
jgi:hypothetical protein